MASGVGYRGTNRCFPFWEDFQQCYFSSTQKTRSDCVNAKEDYLSASTTLKRLHVCALSRPLNGTTMRRIRLMERTIRLYRWLRLDPV
ncbi:hypothetical protein BX661DRAFT_184035, partial [Kickxella alabastrina]|uniref:uncharacterized protein n=1 Tax=Kickxella alabastrina TaxID=61397 RepID=UPI002220A189